MVWIFKTSILRKCSAFTHILEGNDNDIVAVCSIAPLTCEDALVASLSAPEEGAMPRSPIFICTNNNNNEIKE
jgi:hypothetical protein